MLPNAIVTTDPVNSTLIAVNPGKLKHLIAGATDNYCGAGGYGSQDGGSSWFGSCNYLGSPPTVAYDSNGSAYLAAQGDEPEVLIESTQDDGQSWNKAVVAVNPVFSYGYAITPWLAVDNSTTSQYHGRLYIVTTQLDHYDVQSEIAVSYSTDGGNTWSTSTIDKVQVKPELDYYSRVALGADGTVYVTWQRCAMLGHNVNCGGTTAHMMFSKSSDGGATWTAPTKVATVHLAPDRCDCSFFGNLPHTRDPVANAPLIAVDNSTGKYAGSLYVALYAWKGKRMVVEVVTSRDAGKSWSKPVEVAGAYKHDQFFPGISVSPSGTVGVSWLDRRNDPQDVKYQPFTAISTDGGQSFGNNYRLASNLSDPFFGAYSMGDFTGNAWAGDTLYYTWPDTRNAIMQDFIGGLRAK